MSDLCPVAVSQDLREDEFQPETASESHLSLLKQKKYCDVTFIFPNLPDRIEAHQVFLKARSPEFAKLFRMRKSGNVPGNEIKITDSSPDIFQQFLEFIYADKLEVDIAGALDLLQLSHKYKVHPLTKKCEELLQTEIPMVDSVKIFETARRYGHPELMDRAGQIMVKSFFKLVTSGALANAEEETLIYLLECNNLEVQEVGLFQFILYWGRKKVGASVDEELSRNDLKNLILKIRYTNMAPDEFAKVVVPKGLLSAEEIIAVYTYFCVDEATRKDLKIEFNTTPRQVEARSRAIMKKSLDFLVGQEPSYKWFPAFTKHCLSFNADRVQCDGKVLPDYFLKKTVITAMSIWTPFLNRDYKGHNVNIIVSIRESSVTSKERDFKISFQRKLLSCTQSHSIKLSVEPPLELVSGRTYSVIVEDCSTANLVDGFRKNPAAYRMLRFPNINQKGNVYFENLSLSLKNIHRKTDFYEQEACDGSTELALIESIEIGLV